MRAYELMLLLNPELEEEALEAVIQKTTDIVTSRNGEIENIDRWGKRKLAYEVKDYTEGFYVVIRFKADNEATTEVDRVLKITEEVLRFLLVRKDHE
ncbi:MAG: 30S ribosomal protein S6 [Limnochordia bacterium]|nr:30S ribosomal protein S6 [Bacillota bacterium]HOB08311.1 30S ribosomal protein S6 [Limnochordia bacterium]NLH30935.1 30S ribosomal protein S6 [Bacillota bacterium]HPT92597.1 30S ribosomal protein S6 [Limnochordia bacterium]HPZ30553.1 30S ribosomal protein S6 [Limnochordia bacterium]